ncbi:efflux RND transporter periplasmic adaptor subunit [Magnetovibrio sp.]|uniref:efflux RND transporter periplasmic adaptor subunit n=1 Tax=Magnetovibrio sp. TaxID=2024836 RepID=UPI002F942A8E
MRAFLIAALMALAPATGWAAERALSFAVSGVVAEIKVHAGDTVQKGDVLATLDVTTFAAKKRAADEAVKASQVIFELADRRLSQVQELFDALSTSAENVELAETTQANAKMALENARAAQTVATWQLARATLKAPFAGTVSATPGYAGQVVNLNAETAAVVVLSTP